MINKAIPIGKLNDDVRYWAGRTVQCPTAQLTDEADHQPGIQQHGLQSTQTLGCTIDGSMRNTPEGLEFVETEKLEGVGAAIAKQDKPFSNHSLLDS